MHVFASLGLSDGGRITFADLAVNERVGESGVDGSEAL